MGRMITVLNKGSSTQTLERKRFRANLVIFLSVNAALVLAWVGLTIAGVHFKVMLWPSAVVIGLWALRLVFEARAAYRGKPESERYSEDRIQRELSRMP